MRKRNIRVFFRLDKSEKQHLDKLVKKSGLSRETFLRQIIKGYALKEKPDENFYYTMREFSSIGNSLNQLAAKANSLGECKSICNVDMPQIKEQLVKLSKLEMEVRKKFLLPEKVE